MLKGLTVLVMFAMLRTVGTSSTSGTQGTVSTPGTPSPPSLLTVPQQDAGRTRVSPATLSISMTGRFVAFTSFARLARADTNDGADIYVLDRTTGDVTLESASPSASALGCVSRPRLSGDGRFIVFEVAQPAPPGPGFTGNVAIRDRAAGTTKYIESVTGGPPNGWTGAPAISDDGQVIVFASNATNLVDGRDENGSAPDIYMLRQGAGAIERLSVAGRNVQAGGAGSTTPAVSGDGRFIAFAAASDSSLLRIHVRDTRLDVARTLAASANGPSLTPALSRDGEYIAFTSLASNLVRDDRNRASDVFLYEARTGQIRLVSRSAAGGAANGASGSPALSADGRYLAFQSDASDLVCMRHCQAAAEDINLLPDIFVFDRVTETIEWISTSTDGGWIEESLGPAVDGTGRIVGFSSRHPIHAADLANDFDLFVRIGR